MYTDSDTAMADHHKKRKGGKSTWRTKARMVRTGRRQSQRCCSSGKVRGLRRYLVHLHMISAAGTHQRTRERLEASAFECVDAQASDVWTWSRPPKQTTPNCDVESMVFTSPPSKCALGADYAKQFLFHGAPICVRKLRNGMWFAFCGAPYRVFPGIRHSFAWSLICGHVLPSWDGCPHPAARALDLGTVLSWRCPIKVAFDDEATDVLICGCRFHDEFKKRAQTKSVFLPRSLALEDRG